MEVHYSFEEKNFLNSPNPVLLKYYNLILHTTESGTQSIHSGSDQTRFVADGTNQDLYILARR